ncbi:MAG: hypothetical protein BroJett014_23980 [Planctomycetota bacterium]|nr:MAG: hypothetical protein BroJett014_23980 [Planctomycetota bacterium]
MLNLIEKPTFGGHEKFSFRYGWLKKGVDAAVKDHTIFSRDMALVELGVGKNMVRSIRHWCLATNLLEEAEGKGRSRPLVSTDLAKRFILEKGWDPYLEDIGSYWLIHWELVANKIRALIWHILFAQYYEAEFSKAQFIAFCTRHLEGAGLHTTSKMIEREVDCCLRTYVTTTRPQKTSFSEDSLDCPLAELELLRFAPGDNVYSFNVGSKPTLPVQVFGYSLLMFLRPFAHTRRTIAIDDCLYHPGSPGQVFKLDENSLVAYLEELERLTKGKLRLQENAGLRQIYLDESLIEHAVEDGYTLLDNYYE